MVAREGVRYTLNGVELDTENTVVMLGSTYLAGIETTRTVVEVPGMHGTIPASTLPLFKERQVTIRLGVAGDAYHAQTMRLARLCTAPNPTLGRTIDGARQEAVVELASLQADGDEIVGRYAAYTAVFAMPGVWWRGAEPRVHVLSDGGAIPVSGDAPVTDAVLRLPKGVTAASVTDRVSGTGVTWHGGADPGRWTYVSAASLSAWRSDSDSMWNAGGSSAGVDYPAAGPLTLTPGVDGSCSLDVTVDGADGQALIRFRDSWW